MHSYSDLIATVQESAADLVEHQMTRDQERFRFEKQKLALLLVLILSLWVMFFLVWEKLGELCPATDTPAVEKHALPVDPDPAMPDRDEPANHPFHYVI